MLIQSQHTPSPPPFPQQPPPGYHKIETPALFTVLRMKRGCHFTKVYEQSAAYPSLGANLPPKSFSEMAHWIFLFIIK